MSNNLFEKRKLEFIKIVIQEQRLPKVWEFKFQDGEDMRIWFDKISKLEQFKSFINEVNGILKKYQKTILSDKEKEGEFLNCINTIKHIPLKGEMYFSDNSDMYMWYMNYKKKNKDFETIVYINLPEYINFDLETVWPLIKQEFITILKTLKRVPEFGEVILQNDIDVRVVFEKLKKYDPTFIEKLILHLETYNKKGLTIDKRIEELKMAVLSLGYIPALQEVRFTDGTDMFTWYTKYKDKIPNLEIEISSLVTKPSKETKVNIYLIPNFKSKGGKFYTICTNIGEKLDLSEIISFEEAQKIDPTIVKRGGIILKRGEEIGSISYVKGKTKK